jgi:hypothetical protein
MLKEEVLSMRVVLWPRRGGDEGHRSRLSYSWAVDEEKSDDVVFERRAKEEKRGKGGSPSRSTRLR